jgi:two-component system, OmpR family, response regulator
MAKTQNIFLIEDAKMIRDTLTELLGDYDNIEVVGFATNARDAIRWLQSPDNAWDIAVVDIFLERGNGFDVLQAVKPTQPGQRLIMFSNYVNAELRAQAQALGAAAMFDKSTDVDALLAFLTNQPEASHEHHP